VALEIHHLQVHLRETMAVMVGQEVLAVVAVQAPLVQTLVEVQR
jgi:hypothetical protein